MTINPNAVIASIEEMIFEYARDNHGVTPSHVLIDRKLYLELLNLSNFDLWTNDTKRVNKPIFNLTVIEVYLPYPFLAVANLLIGAKSNDT